VYFAHQQTSPGKSARFLSNPASFTAIPFGRWTLVCIATSPQNDSLLYEVRIPRFGSLPPASFRFWVTSDTLAFG